MKVFSAWKNSDMIEGRGPMVIDKVFEDKGQANDYIDTKPGVMGRRAKWSEEKYGDWEVIDLEVIRVSCGEAVIQKSKNKTSQDQENSKEFLNNLLNKIGDKAR